MMIQEENGGIQVGLWNLLLSKTKSQARVSKSDTMDIAIASLRLSNQ